MRAFGIGLLLANVVLAQVPAGLAVVSGRTFGLGSQALRKCTVVLRPMVDASYTGPELKPYGVTSDAEGRFSFNGVDPGRYALSADRAGYLTARYGATKQGAPGRIFTLKAGETLSDADMTLFPDNAISGVVVDEQGEPAPRVIVRALKRVYTLRQMRYQQTSNAITDDEGRFRIGSLQPGKYLVNATILPGSALKATRADAPDTAAVTTYYPSVTDRLPRS